MGFEVKDENSYRGDIAIEYTGLRPGEKLYEELLIGEWVTGTGHPKIMRAKEETLSWVELEILLSKLELACKQIDLKKIRKLLMEAVVGFEPKDEVSDPQWEGREEQSLPTQEQSPKITPLFKS
jgi:FlaA1/EpsC-like NDP-sugar epimerase